MSNNTSTQPDTLEGRFTRKEFLMYIIGGSHGMISALTTNPYTFTRIQSQVFRSANDVMKSMNLEPMQIDEFAEIIESLEAVLKTTNSNFFLEK